MAASSYPLTLPNPGVSAVTPAERRLLSDVTGGPQQARGIQRDYLAQQRVEWTNLNATEALALDDWFNTTLTFGGAWFSSTWPAPQGWVALTRRFIGVPVWAHHSGMLWNVSAEVLVRGRTLAPNLLPPVVSFTSAAEGGVIVLHWTSSGATSASLSSSGAVSVGGSATGAENTSYTFSATNAAGATSATIITPYLPPVLNLSSACYFFTPGFGNAVDRLNWTTSKATAVSLDNGFGPVGLSGQQDLDPRLTYVMTATGLGGTVSATASAKPVHWESPYNSITYSGATIALCINAVRNAIVAYYAALGPNPPSVGAGYTTPASTDFQGYFEFPISGNYGATQTPFHMMCGA